MYQKSQLSTSMIVTWVIATLVFSVMFFLDLGDNPIEALPFTLFMLLFLFIAMIFYRLEVKVGQSKIKLSYGVGLVSFSFSPDQLNSVEVIRTKWYWGFGIRWTPHGWLYNVHGLDAVRVDFTKNGNDKTILIGTEEPQALKEAIEKEFMQSA